MTIEPNCKHLYDTSQMPENWIWKHSEQDATRISIRQKKKKLNPSWLQEAAHVTNHNS